MSSPAALATVTWTLKSLFHGLVDNDAKVTTKPPGKARDGEGEQINIFLYSIHSNTAFSNAPLPGETRNGEHAYPPLPLTLKYLITAYGEDNDDILGQQLLGQAMSLLHDHPVLSREELNDTPENIPDSHLGHQIERIRITPDTLSLDDMSKLWTSFQSEYRLSTGYEVSVVLIESTRARRMPLPVLKRGEDDQGVRVQASLIPPFPAIAEIVPPKQQFSALLGDTLILNGHHLNGDTITVRFTHPQLANPIEVAAAPDGTATQINIHIPDNPADWLVGFYAVEAMISKAGEQDRTTNVFPLTLAPKITNVAPDNPVRRDGSGTVTLTLTCRPEIRPGQRAALLLGDREVLAEAHADKTDELTFIVENAPVGRRHIRLRVDGVDSLLVDRSATPPAFDSEMEVIIT